jgi:hypothetical protein
MEVRYEDLLGDLEGTLRLTCDHLGIEFNSSVLELAKPSENIGDARGATAVLKGNFGKFRDGMSSPVLRRIESIAKEVLLACGYELAYPSIAATRLSPIYTFVARMKDGWNLMRDECKRRPIVAAILFQLRYFKATRG